MSVAPGSGISTRSRFVLHSHRIIDVCWKSDQAGHARMMEWDGERDTDTKLALICNSWKQLGVEFSVKRCLVSQFAPAS